VNATVYVQRCIAVCSTPCGPFLLFYELQIDQYGSVGSAYDRLCVSNPTENLVARIYSTDLVTIQYIRPDILYLVCNSR
jgi:hypothetical protein